MNQSADIAYLDCFSGISGDMLLGALIDGGLSADLLREELAKLALEPFDFSVSRRMVQAISATSVNISSTTAQTLRTLGDITAVLQKSSLDQDVVERSLKIFQRLAEAEGKIHDKPVEQIHFHEVGALDTIIDIVGSVAGLKLLGITRLHASPLPLGRGFVRCAHGNLPLPAPAVCEILKDIPVYGIETDFELVTPTGAALVAELVDEFGSLPPMTIAATGYGAGDSPGTEDRPNLLRVIIGEGNTVTEAQQVEIIETHLDDWSPEGFPFLCSRLFEKNALDVSLTPIQMKKGRPGFCLQVICHPQNSPDLKNCILRETSAIGLRFRTEQRLTLPREKVLVSTSWGEIGAKKVLTPDGTKIYPEYEDCREVAEKHNIPLDRVYREVLFRSENSS
jgi:uncharacterized protein (TIGR00299 family) protein